jgi:hypothetical protein
MSPRRIFRTADAIADLDGIWDYIARDNPAAADRLLSGSHFSYKIPRLVNGNHFWRKDPIAAPFVETMSFIIAPYPRA